MNDATYTAISDAADKHLIQAYELLEDYYAGGDMQPNEALLMVALMDRLGIEDTTCSMTDLVAPDYPHHELSDLQKHNQEILKNFAKHFGKD